ncbi:MAG: DUF523 and DUF1722 domain-containing protein [Gemmatimonadetes bacterium]|nr:DUF523 and DUF1722 domain-containing protein [Gemmatimonadota bacterium]
MTPRAEAESAARFPKPVLVISQCLDFEACRYNGERIAFDLVSELEPFVTYRPVCPEVEIGLGVPRDTIRLVASGREERLLQPATGRDVTQEMLDFSSRFLDGLDDVEGFLLKNRSPTCGPRGIKVYHEIASSSTARHSAGLFAAAAAERFPWLAIEDEGRLRNFRIREHFFTRLFALARLREVGRAGRMRDLVRFQAEHKLVLMAYSQKHLRQLGPLVANPEKRPFEDVWRRYRTGFAAALARTPRYTSVINVFEHVVGYFRKALTPREKAFYRRQLARYRESRIPASTVAGLLQGWAIRFESDYLLDQAFFEPFPEALVSVSDSGKGRVAR